MDRYARNVQSYERAKSDPLNAHQWQEALARIDAGETLADIALTYGVDATTIGRLKN